MAEVVNGNKLNRNPKLADTKKKASKEEFIKLCKKQKGLIAMSSFFVVYVFIFNYLPIWGWVMAFQEYKPLLGVAHSRWVGFQQFETLFKDTDFLRAIRNTLGISVLGMIFNYITAIGLAIFLNELKSVLFKRTVQTISYLPHFVSWVVAGSIVMTTLSTDGGGIVNVLLLKLHLIQNPILFMGEPKYFWGIITISNIWKEVGWNAIIYLAAMTAIDPSIYEAASIDGAGRIKRILNITIPGIWPTVRILLIMQCGWMLSTGFEQILLLQTPLTQQVADVIDTYTLRTGISMGRYSYAAAAGIFKSVISIVLVFSANGICKKFTGEGLM